MKKLEWNLLKNIETVKNAAEKNQFSLVKTPEVETALTTLNKYFETSEIQTIILCAAIGFYFEENDNLIEYKNLANFFDVSIMQILLHNKDFEELRIKQYFTKPEDSFRPRLRRIKADTQMSFSLNKSMIHSILENNELDLNQNETEIDCVEFVNQVAEKIEHRRRSELRSAELFEELEDFEKKHKELKFIKDTKLLLCDFMHRVIFYDVCRDFLTGRDSSLEATLTDIFDSAQSLREAKSLMEGDHPLVSHKLVEFARKGSLSKATVTLGAKGRNVFLAENAALFECTVNDENYIKPDAITEKHLLFSDDFAEQLNELKSYIEEDKLKEIKNRLAAKKLGTSFTILFFGESGTGKTETAYQLAKATGRGIYYVDIASTKSAWFGDSEKALRRIFAKYRTICEQAEKASLPVPILLFNEADAVFQMRTSLESGFMSKTENAMQNILLEELEKINGILIATTNLPQNMDSAFFRRFLFKIKFEKPDTKTSVAIWQNKLSGLSDKSALFYAENYQFSGGQIDNVARKATMFETLHNAFPDDKQMNVFCSEEALLFHGGQRLS